MNINHPYLLRFLVALSLVFLLGFLVYWNVENYREVKTELAQDLHNHMSLSCSEYRDSVVQNIFKIIKLDSSFEVSGMHSSLIQHDRKGDSSESFVFNMRHVQSRQVSGVTQIDDADSVITVVVDTLGSTGPQREIIAWRNGDASSVKIEFTRDTMIGRVLISDDNDFVHHGADRVVLDELPNVFNKIDSIYTRRLKNAGLDLYHNINLKDDFNSNSSTDIIIPFEHESYGLSTIPVAVFSDVRGYIWREMSPSLLMSLILFGVVAISFFAILKSWLTQSRLTVMKNEFISNMTHELKTPISTVGVAIEALENFGALDNLKKRKEYLEISKNEINRLKILVDKVLNMSTLDQDQATLIKSDVDMKLLTDDMLKTMKLQFDKLNVDFDYVVSGSDFNISGDKIHLSNVLYNLIDNAIKYSDEKPALKIDLAADDQFVRITVADKGPGIPSEYVPRIFDRFFRVPTDDTHNVKGHGLGLHYVHTIIGQHDGKVSVESKLGAGTTFIIHLPK